MTQGTADKASDKPDDKYAFERANRPYNYFLLRPPSRWCVPLAVRLGVSPNQVTAAALVTALVGLGLVAAGGRPLAVAGMAVVHAALILDNLDGDLARATGQTSTRGEYLDAIFGYVHEALLLPAAGIGAARAPDLGYDAMIRLGDFSASAFYHVGSWAGIAYLAARLISLRYRVLYHGSFREGAGRIARVAQHVEDALVPLLLVGAALRVISIVLVFYAAYYVSGLLYTVLRSFLSGETAGPDTQ